VAVDEAIRDLLNISTDVRRVAVFAPDGALLGAGPGAVGAGLGAAAARLWDAASGSAEGFGGEALEHVVVQDADGAVAVLTAAAGRVAAVTGPQPAVGLLLFDLRTCLADAAGGEEPA
jgi:predicted regulator of Ras-like GTPase activity (Roadblock/LC7/MglB family)